MRARLPPSLPCTTALSGLAPKPNPSSVLLYTSLTLLPSQPAAAAPPPLPYTHTPRSYAFAGFMHNEFDNTDGWLCPCYSQAGGCGPAYDPPAAPCTMTGSEVGAGAAAGAA